MATNTNELITKLKIVLDKPSLDNIQKSLSKKNLTVKTEIDINEKTLTASIKNVMNNFSKLIPTSQIIGGFTNGLQQAIKELKEIDTYLTGISKANYTLSKSELTQIADNSFDIASKYGKKSADYLAAVQEMTHAGYKNAEDLAELSIAVQSANSMTSEAANSYIIATDKAYSYNGSVEKLKKTLDGANYIASKNTVSMTELASGMSIVGSKAASLGVDANETTAILGTMIATTRQSGSEMANAFQTILLNMQQIVNEENGIDAKGLTKYEEACKALNVSLRETKNGITTLRNPMEILKDLATEYSKLDSGDVRRTNLLDSVGGELNANAFNAILENYDAYETMLGQYADGMGSIDREAEKTANSWEGSLNRLSNTWTDFINNFVETDSVKSIINSLNSVVSLLDKMTEKFGSNSLIIGGLGTSLMNILGLD